MYVTFISGRRFLGCERLPTDFTKALSFILSGLFRRWSGAKNTSYPLLKTTVSWTFPGGGSQQHTKEKLKWDNASVHFNDASSARVREQLHPLHLPPPTSPRGDPKRAIIFRHVKTFSDLNTSEGSFTLLINPLLFSGLPSHLFDSNIIHSDKMG